MDMTLWCSCPSLWHAFGASLSFSLIDHTFATTPTSRQSRSVARREFHFVVWVEVERSVPVKIKLSSNESFKLKEQTRRKDFVCARHQDNSCWYETGNNVGCWPIRPGQPPRNNSFVVLYCCFLYMFSFVIFAPFSFFIIVSMIKIFEEDFEALREKVLLSYIDSLAVSHHHFSHCQFSPIIH